MKPPDIKTNADDSGPAGAVGNVSVANRTQHARWIASIIYMVLLGLVFSKPLLSLIGYAARTPLFSYILCIPFCSAYLIYIHRKELPKEYVCSPLWALLPFVSGLAAWFAQVGFHMGERSLSQVDQLALQAFSFVSFLTAAGFLFLGSKWMATTAFPVAFLFFMTPVPDAALHWLETSLQLASAEAADVLFRISGTPVFRDGAFFELPGYSIHVAQECSGIQASWILFVSTVLASYLLLKSPWRRIVFILVVIPLGIIRNGFRIVTIGLLCVHVGPHMIDSPIHRKGGPLFLALSLIPLSIFLWWLRRGDVLSRKSAATLETMQRETGGTDEGAAERQQT